MENSFFVVTNRLLLFLRIFFSICFGKMYEKLKWSGLDQIWNIAFKIPKDKSISESAVIKTSYWNWWTNFEVGISSFCCQKYKNCDQVQQAFLLYYFENKIKLRSNILKFSPCCLESLLVIWHYQLKICSIILINISENRILNPILWLVSQPQIHGARILKTQL